ncbi:unnamed protein product, partial [Rotaria magnacalcarata]
NLKNLYLDENEMTDGKAVSAILRFRDYTNNCLRLDFYGMGDNLIELLSSVLQRNQTIQHISLITNKIGDRGAQVLASLIKDSKMLISLDLRSNHIGDQGANYLADALINNTTLTTLKLRGNEIGPSGTKYLIDAQKNRTTPIQLEINGKHIEEILFQIFKHFSMKILESSQLFTSISVSLSLNVIIDNVSTNIEN